MLRGIRFTMPCCYARCDIYDADAYDVLPRYASDGVEMFIRENQRPRVYGAQSARAMRAMLPRRYFHA